MEVAQKFLEKKFADENFKEKLFDTHLATLEMLVYNAKFRNSLKTDDFKLIKEKKPKIDTDVLAFDMEITARAQENLRRKGRLE